MLTQIGSAREGEKEEDRREEDFAIMFIAYFCNKDKNDFLSVPLNMETFCLHWFVLDFIKYSVPQFYG